MGTNSSGQQSSAGSSSAPVVRWDDSNLRSTYCNVVNATGTREEIILLFGNHQTWHSEVKEVVVQLSERIVLNPFAAKRLHALLGIVLREYESRYGTLQVDGVDRPRAPELLPTKASAQVPRERPITATKSVASTSSRSG